MNGGISFTAAAKACIIVLEHGTEKGKQQARDEIMRYARELDCLAVKSCGETHQ